VRVSKRLAAGFNQLTPQEPALGFGARAFEGRAKTGSRFPGTFQILQEVTAHRE
jgi:hypothetical protein